MPVIQRAIQLDRTGKYKEAWNLVYSAEITLRPKALIDAFPFVSQQRVAEVRNEYPELEQLLARLPILLG